MISNIFSFKICAVFLCVTTDGCSSVPIPSSLFINGISKKEHFTPCLLHSSATTCTAGSNVLSINPYCNKIGVPGYTSEILLTNARYLAFVRRISEVYPGTPILLQYGLMERTLLPAVQVVAEECSRQGVKCSFLEIPLMNKDDGMGTDEHPSVVTHKKTAHILKEKILEIMDWKE